MLIMTSEWLQQGNMRTEECERLVVDTYLTPSLRTYSSLSARPFFWKTAMTALWMLQCETHKPASALRAACWSLLFQQAGGGRCVPVPGGVGPRPLLLIPSVLWWTLLTLPQLAETGRAHQLEPMQSPHGGDMVRNRDTLSTGQQKRRVKLRADVERSKTRTELEGRRGHKRQTSVSIQTAAGNREEDK